MVFALPDLDEVLAYKTKKVVIVKDRYLGILWGLGLLGVLLYFIVSELIIDRAHLVREPFLSVVETSLRRPPSMQDPSALSYCQGGPGNASLVLPCSTGPDIWVQSPSTGNAEMFVATRLKDIDTDGNDHRSFVQEPERYTLGISLAIHAPQNLAATGDAKYSRSMQELQTMLLDKDGAPMPEAIERVSRFDVIEVGSLLRAADIDDPDTVRYKGAVLLVTANCPMDSDGSASSCQYTVRRVKDAEAKTYIFNGIDARTSSFSVQERRGLKIIVSPSGSMGRFKWSAVLIAWVSSLGMLGLVRLGVDLLMTKVMPLRAVYSMLKWEHSMDFSDYRDGLGHAHAQADHIKAQRNRFSRDNHASDNSNGNDATDPEGNVIGRRSSASSTSESLTEERLKQVRVEMHDQLREQLLKSLGAQQAKFEEQLREYFVSEISKERDFFNERTQRFWHEQSPSGHRGPLEPHLEYRLAQNSADVQNQLKAQFAAELHVGLAGLKRYLLGELSAAREQQRKDMRNELSHFREVCLHTDRGNLHVSEAQLSDLLVKCLRDVSVSAADESGLASGSPWNLKPGEEGKAFYHRPRIADAQSSDLPGNSRCGDIAHDSQSLKVELADLRRELVRRSLVGSKPPEPTSV
eukprot:TRINITY_DN38057_c0_g1_i1.p1 TRINITY_DN38057_c0_g1~~TRINITY_DN38057_c0_g1_i1.p1  ORF type:complete len:650 (+),score=75.15 TRINITY_DN38057_c0_g1_i1:47-1951(+)